MEVRVRSACARMSPARRNTCKLYFINAKQILFVGQGRGKLFVPERALSRYLLSLYRGQRASISTANYPTCKIHQTEDSFYWFRPASLNIYFCLCPLEVS